MLQAQDFGKITGRVVDENSGNALIGANVMVEGTSLGSATDADGQFTILAVPVGTHIIRCDYIGYSSKRISNVAVSNGLTTTQDYKLAVSAIKGAVVEVRAEKPIINKNSTNTTRIIDSETIENLPLRGVESIVATQTGTVADDGNIYVRGSRAGDVAYYVDGVYMNNAWSLDNTSTVSNSAMEEVQFQSGGFSAEYGNVNGGVVNTTTRSGGKDLAFSGEFIMGLGASGAGNDDGLYSNGYNLYNFNVGGPVGDNVRYFFSYEGRATDDRNPSTHPYSTLDRTEFNSDEVGFLLDEDGNPVKDDFENVSIIDISGSTDEFLEDGVTPNPDYNASYGVVVNGFDCDGCFFDYDLVSRYNDEGALITDTLYAGYNNYQTFYGSKVNAGSDRMTVSGNLLFDLNPLILKVGGSINKEEGRSYNHSFSLVNSMNNPRFESNTLSLYANATFSISETSFLKFNASYYNFTDEYGDNTYWNDLGAYGVVTDDTYLVQPGQNQSSLSQTAKFSAFGSVYDDYDYNETSYIGLKSDYLNQFGDHELRAGFDYRKNTIKYYRLAQPLEIAWQYSQAAQDQSTVLDDEWIFNTYHDAYAENLGYSIDNDATDVGYQDPGEPVIFGAYFQDKIELEDLIVNAGLRFDYFDPNTEAPADWDELYILLGKSRGIDRDASNYEKVDAYSFINPRLGFSFPVTDETKFHAQYGKFTQHPVLSSLYLSDTRLSANLTQGNMTVSPNPSLKPEETTQYEVGFTQQVGSAAALDITGYYKEVRNYTMMANRNDAQVNGNGLVWAQFQNGDFGIVKGLSFNLNMRRVKGLLANVSYTLSYAEGTGSDEESNFNIAWIGDTYPTIINPLEYDQRHTGSVMLDYRFEDESGFFANSGINLLYQFGSGTAYTPTQVYSIVNDRDWLTPVSSINSAYKPWTTTLDLKLDKGLNIAGYDATVYLLVNNVLNTDNVDEVYPGSGEAGTDAWLNTSNGKDWLAQHENGDAYYTAKISDPRRWDAPRQIRLGLTIGL